MSKSICPCCGEKFEGDLSAGCAACGARRVGPPLQRPERVLPGYGHAFVAGASGLLLLLSLAAAFAAAMWERETLSLDADALLRAAETAAWRLKWSTLPASLAFLLLSTKLYVRVRRDPARHAGRRFASAGLALTVVVALAFVTLIGITIPERMRMRELARRAAENAQLYATDEALARYRQQFGTYPAALEDLRRLEDKDGSIARVIALANAGEYKPESDIASLSTSRAKARNRHRGSALRGRAGADDVLDTGLVLTDYAVTLPGRDKILGTDDDLHIHNGVISDTPRADAKSAATPVAAAGRIAH